MKVITSVQDMQAICRRHYRSGVSIGFVPTMGYLHEGHLSLMKEARVANDIVVVSVFVNPLQFGPNEDFESYPRDAKGDEALAEEAGVDYLFYPTTENMYPKPLNNSLKALSRTGVLCGRSRPGHFDGVVTVLAKLFNIVSPDRVYMGLKDAQQVAVVQGLVDDYNIPTEIVPVPTVREADGLAKSSRNVYLNDAERHLAPRLHEALVKSSLLVKDGQNNPQVIVESILDFISDLPGSIDYVEVLSYPELEPIEALTGQVIIALAYRFSKARLIDNIIIDAGGIANV